MFDFSSKDRQWGIRGGVLSGAAPIFLVNGREYGWRNAVTVAESGRKRLDNGSLLFEMTAEFADPAFLAILHVELLPGGLAFTQVVELVNNGREGLVIGDSRLFSISCSRGGAVDLGPEPERCICFNFRDTLADNWVARLGDQDGVHGSTPFCHVHNPATGLVFFAGQLSFEEMRVCFDLKFDLAAKRVERLDCTLPFAGFELKPGGRIASATVLFEVAGDGPYRVLEDWATRVHDRYHPVIPEQASVGWLGWSWIDGMKTEVPEAMVERNLRALKTRLAGFEINYLWISIANLKDGLPGNWLEPDTAHFPKGMDTMLAKIKAAGLTPGLWIAPFYMVEGAEPFERLKPCFFKKNGGEISARYEGWLWAAKATDDALPRICILDPSHPGTEAYLREVFAAYRRQGVGYFMVDFLGDAQPWECDVPHDPAQVRGWAPFRKCMEAIRETCGPETHLLSAVGSTLAQVGTVSSSRIGMDYGEGRCLFPRFPSYPANYVINGSFGSAGSPNQNAVRNLACWYFAHRKFFLCNSNILTVDKPIPRNEAEISASLFGLSGGPMMLGDDLDTMAAERLALVTKCLPRPISAPFPADLFAGGPEPRVFVVPVRKPWGDWYVVGVFNLERETRRFTLDADRLRLVGGTDYRFYDFWNESYGGLFRDTRTVEVPANSCKIYRLEEVKPHPWLLSTDMHVRQGEAELLDLEWDAATTTLRGVVSRPRGQTGNLYVIAPWRWKERHFNKNLWVAKSAIDDSLVIRKEIRFEQVRMEWRIEFVPLGEKELAACQAWRNKV